MAGIRYGVPRLPRWRGGTAAVLAVFVLGAVVTARLADPGATGPGGVAATPGRVAPAPHSSFGDDGIVVPSGSPSVAPVTPGALARATAFVRAWVTHPAGAPADRWWQAVSAHADPTLAGQLRSADPAQIPANRVTGAAVGLSATPTSARVAVPTDAGRVVVLCVVVDGRWVVATVDLERPAT